MPAVAPQVPAAPPQAFAPTLRFGQPGEVRSPVKVWLLGFVTLGIYALMTHYRLNREMKEFTSTINVSPALAVFACFIPIAAWVTMFKTSERIRQTQVAVGLRPDCGGFVTFLCSFVGASWAYQQGRLNRVWLHVAAQSR
jgi:hypothetical protein